MGEYSIGDKAMKERFFGIYQTADLVPTFGINPFDSKEWIETSVPTQIKTTRDFTGKHIPESYFFPIISVIDSVIREKGVCKVIDIGGVRGKFSKYIWMPWECGTGVSCDRAERKL